MEEKTLTEQKQELTEQDKDLLLRGIRPEWMEYSIYKSTLKGLKAALKKYKRGRAIYHAYESVETKEKTDKITMRSTGPYRKPVNVTEKS